MRLYEIEITQRYSVTAESVEHALGSYRVVFDGVEPELVGLTSEEVLKQDDFEYLDGSGRAVWAGAEK